MRKGMAKRTRTGDLSSASASAEAAEEGRRRLCNGNGKTATSKVHYLPQASLGDLLPPDMISQSVEDPTAVCNQKT